MPCKSTYRISACRKGAEKLRAAYRQVILEEGIDAIIFVDGGVDSLMRGDEEGPGSILQDTLSLLVVSELDLPIRNHSRGGEEGDRSMFSDSVFAAKMHPLAEKWTSPRPLRERLLPIRILACVGFGAETDEGVCHFRALENMAALAKDGCFLGACALTAQMEAFQYYESVCRRVFEQPGGRSHVHTRIIPAVHGEFVRYQMYDDPDQPLDLLSDRPEFINPLMSLYWFFDAAGVRKRNLLAEHLANTVTYQDVLTQYDRVYGDVRNKVRKNRVIPL